MSKLSSSRNSQQQQTYNHTLPLVSKIQQFHINNLQHLLSIFCQICNQLIKLIDAYQIQISEKQLSIKTIIAIKQANSQLRYHQKINPNDRIQYKNNNNLTEEIDQIVQYLTKMKGKEQQNVLPKVRRFEEINGSGVQGQLSTIVQKYSQQNLLHNYLKKNGHSRKPSKSNISKNTFVYNTSSIEDLQFEVIRQETRKSLDNPYHKNNQNRKGLYNDLQKIKGQDNLLPSVRTYLDKHRKNGTSKLMQYQINKLI